MAVIEWIVMTPAERARATTLNDDDAMLGARRVTLGPLAGKWVVPARLLHDPDYARWWDALGPLPRETMAPEGLFPPPDEAPETT